MDVKQSILHAADMIRDRADELSENVKDVTGIEIIVTIKAGELPTIETRKMYVSRWRLPEFGKDVEQNGDR